MRGFDLQARRYEEFIVTQHTICRISEARIHGRFHRVSVWKYPKEPLYYTSVLCSFRLMMQSDPRIEGLIRLHPAIVRKGGATIGYQHVLFLWNYNRVWRGEGGTM